MLQKILDMPSISTKTSLLSVLFVALIVIVANARFCLAFHSNGVRLHHRHATLHKCQRIFSSANDEQPVVEDDKKSSMMTLNLIGDVDTSSKFAPVAGDKTLRDFFALPDSVVLLLEGSKDNKVKKISCSDALMEEYKQMCDRVNVSPASPEDRFFEVTTAGVNFPGLTILSIATIGTKVIGTSDLPAYEFVLIKDTTMAEGNRLFVWFFNKVTGKDKDEATSSVKDPTTLSVNTINAVRKEDMITFESAAYLNIQIQFPAFLMKAIPGASKEKYEKTGGESLRKVLEKDCPVALEAFRQAYLQWLEN